jgi:hypothetical protein
MTPQCARIDPTTPERAAAVFGSGKSRTKTTVFFFE